MTADDAAIADERDAGGATASAPDRDDPPAAAVRDAIAAAGVGEESLHADLVGLDAIGAVSVREGRASVEITLPVPSEPIRERLASGVADAVTSVEGVAATEVAFRGAATSGTPQVDMLPDVKHVVAVASGKGGVGKSTVATNLAAALADAGASVGLVDADVYGPNAPRMLGLDDEPPETTSEDRMVPRERHGVRAMSMGFVADEDDPVIWRGPLVDEFVKQLFGDVTWGELDYLIVDTPPGTGDVHLSLVQHLPVSGVVVVTTPEAVAVDDAARGLVGFARYDVPVLGVVENMAGFTCPDCGAAHDPFGRGGGDELADGFEVPVLGQIPLDPAVGTFDDADAPSPPGIDLPVVGRLQLPRTREERQTGTGRPLVLCEDGGETRQRLRAAATRIAARVNQAAVELDD